AFGGAGPATVLHKITVGAAFLFMVTCLFLSFNPSKSTMDTDINKRLKETPATKPAPPAPAPPGNPAPGTPQGAAPTTPDASSGVPKESSSAPTPPSEKPAGGASSEPRK